MHAAHAHMAGPSSELQVAVLTCSAGRIDCSLVVFGDPYPGNDKVISSRRYIPIPHAFGHKQISINILLDVSLLNAH